MANRTPWVAFTLLSLFTSSFAGAQSHRPPAPVRISRGRLPMGHPPVRGRRGMGAGAISDCVVTGGELRITHRRVGSVVDLSFNLYGVEGGPCSVRPEAIMLTSRKSAAVSRAVQMLFVGPKPHLPLSTRGVPGARRLSPYTGILKKGQLTHVAYRYYVMGGVDSKGAIDPLSRIRIDMRGLGPRVVEGAPLSIMLTMSKDRKARVTVGTGNPGRRMPTQDALTKIRTVVPLGKNDVLPVVEWELSGEAPSAITAESVKDGLGAFEYLRDGFAREFLSGITTLKKGSKKVDEKVAKAAWDRAFDAAFAATRSKDPLVAAQGERAMAWLAGGLTLQQVHVKAAGGSGPGVEIPAAIVSKMAYKAPEVTRLAGTSIGLPPTSGRGIRALLARAGTPGAHKKSAEEGLKRLAKRLEDDKLSVKPIGAVFALTKPADVGKGVMPSKRHPIAEVNPRAVLARKRAAESPHRHGKGKKPPRSPFASRVVRRLSHRKGVIPALAVLTLLGGAIWGVIELIRRRRLAASGKA